MPAEGRPPQGSGKQAGCALLSGSFLLRVRGWVSFGKGGRCGIGGLCRAVAGHCQIPVALGEYGFGDKGRFGDKGTCGNRYIAGCGFGHGCDWSGGDWICAGWRCGRHEIRSTAEFVKYPPQGGKRDNNKARHGASPERGTTRTVLSWSRAQSVTGRAQPVSVCKAGRSDRAVRRIPSKVHISVTIANRLSPQGERGFSSPPQAGARAEQSTRRFTQTQRGSITTG